MQKMRSIIRHLPGFVIVFALMVTGCATPPSTVVEPDPAILRVGVTPDSPPLIYKQNDVVIGLEADMATKLAEYLHKTAVFVEVPWKDQLSALQSNRTDIIMSGMSVTPARQFEIAFSRPYFRSGQMILVKDLQKYNFIKNVETVVAQSITWRIGVVEGTTGEAFVREKNIGAKAINAYADPQQALDALTTGRIDVFFHDAPVIVMMAAQHRSEGINLLPVILNEEYLAWGLRKSDTELVESVNAYIDQASREGSLQATIKRWIPLAR